MTIINCCGVVTRDGNGAAKNIVHMLEPAPSGMQPNTLGQYGDLALTLSDPNVF